MQDGNSQQIVPSSSLPIVYGDDNSKEIIVKNKKKAPSTTTVTLKKVDSTDATIFIEGAKFELLKSDGTEFGDYTSGADGTITITGLAPGTYTLKETAAAAGYYTPDKDWTIIVADDLKITVKDGDGEAININNDDNSYHIENIPIDYNLPSTGGFGSTPFKTVGTALMLVAVLGYIYYARDKKERRLK